MEFPFCRGQQTDKIISNRSKWHEKNKARNCFTVERMPSACVVKCTVKIGRVSANF